MVDELIAAKMGIALGSAELEEVHQEEHALRQGVRRQEEAIRAMEERLRQMEPGGQVGERETTGDKWGTCKE